jgi:hypothetical protein
MGVPTSEVGYISATTGRGDHEVHKGHGGIAPPPENNFGIVISIADVQYWRVI